MVDRKHDPRDHNIWKSPGGALFFKLGIPPNLRSKFMSSTGKPKTKISEPLGTDSLSQARVLRDQKLAHWRRVFARMAAGVPLLAEDKKAEGERIREETLATLRAPPTDEQKMLLHIARAEAEVEAMRRFRDGVRAALDQVSSGVASVAERHGISIEKGSALYADVANAVLTAIGEATESHNVKTAPPAPVAQPAAAAPANRNGNLERFSEVVDTYLTRLVDREKARAR